LTKHLPGSPKKLERIYKCSSLFKITFRSSSWWSSAHCPRDEIKGIKVGLPDEVQSTMVTLLAPLGRELRASIDFFEHQQDKTVTQVFIGGGSARSELIAQTLQTELMVECKPWNPVSFLQLALPPQQTAEMDQVAAQLAVAVGAALATF